MAAPAVLRTPPSNTSLPLPGSLHPKPVPKHSNSTSTENSDDSLGIIGRNLLSSTNTPTDSEDDGEGDDHRSSGEVTAVTIYSMYSDNRDRDLNDGMRVPLPTSRPSSSKGYDEAHLSVSVSGSAGRHASRTTWAEYHRPTSAAVSSRPSSRNPDGRRSTGERVSFSLDLIPSAGAGVPEQLSVLPATPTSSTMPHLPAIPDRLQVPSSRPTSAASRSHHQPSPRSRTPSPSPSSRAASPSYETAPSDQGEVEDADSFHVRSTYARLDQSGVPGDGYEEGIERTRARAPDKVKRRATVFGEKTGELNEQEAEFLSSLDRYGFKAGHFQSREPRIVKLPALNLSKLLTPVKTPPTSPAGPKDEVKTIPEPVEGPKESERIAKWQRMMKVAKRDIGGNVEKWTFDERKGKKLRERMYKGVPDRWRAAAWFTIIDSASATLVSTPGPTPVPPPPATSPSPHPRRDPRRMPWQALADEYREMIDRPSTHDIQIDLDVPRTISGHVMFHTRYGSGQRSLFHVLHSFSLICETCGYCQGMGPIAATLLCYLEPERAYACMVRIHDAYDMHSIFSPGFPGLLESIYVQERLIERFLPDVFTSFKKHMISTTSYATKWYITLFANTFTFQTQLRLWDAFFLEGRDVIVLAAMGIIWVYRGASHVPSPPCSSTDLWIASIEHMASAQASFETILSLLSSFFIAESEDALMGWIGKALGDKKLRGSMVQWRKDWRELVRTGKDRTALM